MVGLRFGIEGQREHTLEEVGQEFPFTRERTRQIEVKAIKELKRALRDKVYPRCKTKTKQDRENHD
ncbi:MAG: hypothetical protein HYW01_02510 [Deltaproteobacteria bacterium]|nr:hypothetical protein [Deltaproteobacteria bacterium]